MEFDLLLRPRELPSAAAPHRTWAELHGGALRLAAAEAAARHLGTVCVIAASAADADKLEREMAFFGPRALRRFPDYETLPYEPISPPQDLLADRLLALNRLARGERETLVLEAGALLERLAPPEFIVSRSLSLAVGDRFDPTQMSKRLSEHGYLRVEQVAEPGEFAVRGAVFDVFPTGSAAPVRVDLFDDEIETLRTFDAETQRSAGKTDRIEILPAREFPFDEAAIKFFRERFREHFPVAPGRCPVYRTISDAQLPVRHLSLALGRAAADRHRVLLASVLQDDRFAVRLPARRHAARRPRRRPRRARRLVAARLRALRAAQGRHRAADPYAEGRVPRP